MCLNVCLMVMGEASVTTVANANPDTQGNAHYDKWFFAYVYWDNRYMVGSWAAHGQM